MLSIHLYALFGISIFVICSLGARNHTKSASHFSVCLLFGAAFFLRLTAAGISGGFDSDTACFAAWAERIFHTGPSGFYSTDYFSDYPPGYLLLLWPAGALRNLLGLEYYSALHLILLRLPAILSDLLCGLLLYREASGRYQNRLPLLFAAAYLFNPSILLNSAVWGQADSVYTLCLVILCLSLMRGRMLPALTSFGLGLVIKPQMIIFTPVLFLGLWDYLRHNRNRRSLLKLLGTGLAALLFSLLPVLPFGLQNVLSQYTKTLGSYPYAAVNACNFWGLLGFNWVSQDSAFLGFSCRFYGYLAIFFAVVLVLYLNHRLQKDPARYPLLCAVLMSTVYLFSVRMHERYLYAAVVLLLFACLYRPFSGLYLYYGCFSILHFYNAAWVLFLYDPSSYDRKSPYLLLISAGMLLCYWGFLGSVRKILCHKEGAASFPPALSDAKAPLPSKASHGLTKKDAFLLVAITLFYSCFALYDLGDTAAPQSAMDLKAGETIQLSFEKDGHPALPARMSYYIGPEHHQSYEIAVSDSCSEISMVSNRITLDNVFTWQTTDLEPMILSMVNRNPSIDRSAAGFDGDTSGIGTLCLTAGSENSTLLELVFLDEEGIIMLPTNASDYPALFDEQALYPDRFIFRNSMYFDEIYHGRSAYEMLHGYQTYENTHPPLGKILISAGISLFGMTPFGWRIAGTFLGIMMVPVMYLFARLLTGNTALTALTCCLFAFDFMHFTQSRIATIDVFVTFFILLMYLFMYRYCQMSFYDTALYKTFLPLGACGLCFGLGVACKWTGFYAGLGLSVMFFGLMYRRYQEYRYAKCYPGSETNGIPHREILVRFLPCLWKTLVFCIGVFVVLPMIIYLVSYLPFRDGSEDSLILRCLHNQQTMIDYHTGLVATHSFSSPCYDWPVMKRPVWYYSGILTGSYLSGGLREGISAFGNPLVWWVGIPASVYCFYLAAKKKDRTAAFLSIGYLAQYLPWFFVSRIAFIYHYFPCTVFVVLMIAYSLYNLKKHMSHRQFKIVLVVYGVAAFGLFLLFYPVLSGQAVDADYVSRYLRWFDGWVLTLD